MSAAVHIEQELTVYTAHELKVRLLAALTPGEALQVDLSEVREVDGAGVQLLLALSQECRKREIKLCLKSPPLALVESFKLVDICSEFACEENIEEATV
ncbi:lipid asymmetry maintenance protein MlaB [Aquabacterium sp. NJ1]|uniref:STAS domain-containing protein n=1 Tax=Aquabacterium sp. NJ1 TaxID=1538295 RepID=UPI00068C3673|nr:STAS domain-containing protein [Aquabacterium sp. NJ1]